MKKEKPSVLAAGEIKLLYKEGNFGAGAVAQ